MGVGQVFVFGILGHGSFSGLNFGGGVQFVSYTVSVGSVCFVVILCLGFWLAFGCHSLVVWDFFGLSILRVFFVSGVA